MAYTPSITASDIWRMQQREEKNRKEERARELYQQGMSLYEISNRVGLSERELVSVLGLG